MRNQIGGETTWSKPTGCNQGEEKHLVPDIVDDQGVKLLPITFPMEESIRETIV
jgi:hypothetical protein